MDRPFATMSQAVALSAFAIITTAATAGAVNLSSCNDFELSCADICQIASLKEQECIVKCFFKETDCKGPDFPARAACIAKCEDKCTVTQAKLLYQGCDCVVVGEPCQ